MRARILLMGSLLAVASVSIVIGTARTRRSPIPHRSISQAQYVAVNADNNPPSFTKGADQTITINAGPQTVTNWATDISAGPPEESDQTLSFIVTNDNNSLFASQPEIDPSGTLTYESALNASGLATVTVLLTDSGDGENTSAPQTFQIVVNCATATVVTNTNDSGVGSLREAIANACPSDTITFDATAFEPLGSPYTITLASELTIDKDLTIEGPQSTRLIISGGAASRVFNINSGSVNISNLTISDGQTASIPGDGAGLQKNGAGTVTINNSTFTNNTAQNGGAIAVHDGILNLHNSTISGNNAVSGGGIFGDGTATINILNSTVYDNHADASVGEGGGISSFSGITNVKNTIVAGNTAATGAEVSGTIVDQGNNILTGDPKLGPLSNNGGQTRTHLPLIDSPALHAGDNIAATVGGLTTDQRGAGFSRITDSYVDTGAVEASYAISATAGSGQSAAANDAFAIQLQATVTESGVPQSGVPVTFNAPSSGASGTFPDGSITTTINTDVEGVATAPIFTANGIPDTYVVTASLSGNWLPATFTLTNAKADQAITFEALSPKIFGDPPFSVSATASSGLAVSFSIVSGPATISDQTVTITGAGTVTVRASQEGDTTYNPALPVDQSFSVAKANQVITFNTPANKIYGNPDFNLNATASSNLIVNFAVVGHCTVTGSAVHLTGAGSCTVTATQSGNSNFNAAPSVRRSFFITTAGENSVVLTTFGAVGDGVTNDGPAIQSALDALATAGRGRLLVPEGRYAITTPVAKDFTGLGSSISITGIESSAVVDHSAIPQQLAKGLDLLSEFLPKTGPEQVTLRIAGLQSFQISDIAFVGTPDIPNDALITLAIVDVEDATVRHCEFYGLSTIRAGGSIVLAMRSGLRMEQTKFLGSFGASGLYVPNVQNVEWKSINVTDVVFVDYGLRPELFCKCNFGATWAWINIGNAALATPLSPRREVVLRNVFFDEGAYMGVSSMPANFQPPSAPIDLMYITGLRMNVSNFGTTGHYLTGLERLLIENARYGWSHNATSAIELHTTGNAIIDRTECVDAADRITADALTGKLTVIDSTYASVDSLANTTKLITTLQPEDDPVWYVRQQFLSILDRDPDATGHYYWSDRILQCDENTQCVNNKRAELAAYLNTGPSPNFSITGRVTNESGASLPGVVVALGGSQSVTTQTDAEGRYVFAGLPTSGAYTVIPSRANYTFGPPSMTITTPNRDQATDFSAILNRHTVSGHVTNGSGQVMAGTSVTLSGSQTDTAVTDTSGNYSFTVLAEGDYTITPSKANYTFSPGATSYNELVGDRASNFTGTLVNYTISGQVTLGGSGLSGATLTLSGSQAASTVTDANGNYTFTVEAGGNYTLIASKTHYTFASPQQIFNNMSGNSVADFAATLNQYQIVGRVTNSGGSGFSGVTLTLSGSQSATATTNSNGDFSFASLPAGGNYTVTPAFGDYDFTPTSQTFNDLSADQQPLFTSSLIVYTISGRVADPSVNPAGGGVGLEGITVTLSGSITKTTQTSSDGTYSIVGLPEGGTYSIKPTSTNWSFSPASDTFTTGPQSPGFINRNRVVNFEAAPIYLQFSASSYTANEDSVAVITITRLGSISGTSTINYATSDGSATTGSDYVSVSGTLIFAPGEITKTIAVPLFYEAKVEGSETILLTLSNPTGSISRGLTSAVLTVLDPAPLLLADASLHAIALDSVTALGEPFPRVATNNFSSDQRTRIMLFTRYLDFAPGETQSAVTIRAEDSQLTTYELPVEFVGKVPGYEWLTQVNVRLPSNITPGDVTVRIYLRGIVSNSARIRVN